MPDPMRKMSRRRAFLVLALCGIVLAACNRDPRVRKQKYFASAIKLLNQGKRDKAVLDLRNALQVDPNFVEAANVLAELEARSGNYRDAFVLLDRAAKAKPDYLPVRKGLAQLYKAAGKFTRAQEEINYILQRTPDDTDVLFLQGSIQADQKKYGDAAESFNRILKIQPAHVQALLALASVQENSGDAVEAEHYRKLAVERDPRAPQAYLALIKFYLDRGRSADADALFAQALKMTGNDVRVLEAGEVFYRVSGRLPEAEDLARKLESLHPEEPKYWTAVADFYIASGNWAKAKSELERDMARHKDDRYIVYRLIGVHLALHDLAGAQTLNDALLKAHPKDSYAHFFRGRLYLAQGDVANALLQFNETRSFQPDYPGLYYWYAQAYLQRRQYLLARDSLRTALKYDPGYFTARLQLAEIENQAGDSYSAMLDARRALASNANDTRAMLAYSQALIQTRQYNEAGKVLDAVVKRYPNNSGLHRQLGILDLVKNKPAAAEKEFTAAWSLDPASKPLLDAVLLGYTAKKQGAAARDFVEREIKSRSQDPLLYHELAQVDLLLGQRSEAVTALRQALSLAPGNAESALLLAQTYIEDNQPGQALPLIDGVMKGHAGESDAMLRAGMLLEKLERWDQARQAYAKAVQLDSGNAIAKNNLAWLLVSRGGDLDQALGLAQQAKEQLSDNVQVSDTLGWIYYKRQLYRTALEYLRQCVAADRKNATFQYQLGLTYWKLGDAAQARQALQAAIRLDPQLADTPSIREALASL